MKKGTVNQFNIVLVYIQGILTLVCLIVGIMCFFEPKAKLLFPFCLGTALFSLAYNNSRIYGKKNFTFYYITEGIFCFVYGIIKLWW